MKKLFMVAVVLLASVAGALAGPATPSNADPPDCLHPDGSPNGCIYTVTSNGDDGDQSIGDGVCADHSTPTPRCTLRAAIQESNATQDLDEIDFSIPSDSPYSTCIYDRPEVPPEIQPPITAICPTYTLPSISAPLIIDGTTQPGYAGTPIIELDGHNGNGVGVGPGVDGLIITAGGSRVKGLWIHGFGGYGIDLRTTGDNHIEANWIGDIEDANDDLTDPWWPNMNDGIFVDNIPGNFIGGTTSDKRNVISGNGGIGTSPGYGVTIAGASAHDNLIQGNYIGTDPAGTLDKGNTKAGVYINGAPNNTVGGTDSTTPGGPCTGACNLISGNNGGGIEITGAAATGNLVAGNFIGTTADGLAARSNTGNGVYINGASNNIIGGTTASARNVISKNSTGVTISGSSTGNVVQGNYIGTNATGAAALGNTGDGVAITSAPGNTVGGTAAGARNIISGNAGRGITISASGASGNVVEGNFIGTDVSGEANVHNNSDGIYINTPNNRVGGTTAAARNIIAYNGTAVGSNGVEINGSAAQGNLIQGNYIGVNISLGIASNYSNGVGIITAQKNTIGGPTAAERNLILNNGVGGVGSGVDISGTNAKENVVRGNVISNNRTHGIHVNGSTATLNLLAGNLIGTDETGMAARGNGSEGVYIENAPSNTVGGTAAADRNVVSDNGRGVTIYGAAATGNLVQGNFIGTDITGAVTDPDATPNSGDELGNISDGVFISRAPGNTIGGTAAGARNVISGNGAVGVEIYEPDASGNYVQGNFIGTDISGTISLGNTADGVYINNAPANVIGGTTTAARNVISANHSDGLNISGSGATGNVIQGNHIGTNTAGTNDPNDLGNAYDGVRVGAFSSNTSVGGTLAGAGNTIGFNGGNGVLVDRSTGNGILGNSISSSQVLGIDLVTATAGFGPNWPQDNGDGEPPIGDTGAPDADTGGNNYQNFPELTQAVSTGGSTTVQGTFKSTPSTSNYRIEFFSNATCKTISLSNPPYDFRAAEGKQYLGSTTVNTNGSGNATINLVLPTALAHGLFITATATATGPSNNTSEFSQCREVTGPPDADSDGITDSLDNCPLVANADQLNTDGSRRPNGPQILNEYASNPAQDMLGDACDSDDDNDGMPDASENDLSCPYRLQADSDGDRIVDSYELAVSTNECSSSSTPTCSGVPFADGDLDGLSDCIEHSGYNSCASANDLIPGWSACATPMDSDGDGCADVLEVMDINGDRKVTIADQTLLAKRAVGLLPASDSDPIFDVNKTRTITVADQTLMAKNTCTLKPGLIGCEGDQVCPAE